MRRRSFLTLLGGAAAAWPLAARAQQRERMRRIGVLYNGIEDDPKMRARVSDFRQGLEKLGWSEDRNIRLEMRFATNADQFLPLAKELIALQPDVILADTTPAAAALQRESRVVPIVFRGVSDPIGSGFITSLARPGSNLTGLLAYEEGIIGKWLAMLKEIAPHLTRAAIIANPRNQPYEYFLRSARDAAPRLGLGLVATRIENAASIEPAIESFARVPNGGLVFLPDATIQSNRDLVITLAARHRLPAVYPQRYFVTDGGLMSYDTDLFGQFRQAATYIDRILRGEKPADLPV
jgi:ABC-type uncharacterized transport system substrate-binding protein